MTVEEFDSGYWYAVEVRRFAKDIGLKSISKLRKDELEDLIKHFLETGKIEDPQTSTKPRSKTKDNESGLSLSLRVVNYADIKETKDFIMREALKIDPHLRRKSGAQYRLNRWREEKIALGRKITYQDLINKFVDLCHVKGSFPQARSGRYINFLSDFLSNEKHSTREEAVSAWHELKKLNVPKTYKDWKRCKSSI